MKRVKITGKSKEALRGIIAGMTGNKFAGMIAIDKNSLSLEVNDKALEILKDRVSKNNNNLTIENLDKGEK